MGILRQMHPQYFTKKAKEEKLKYPKSPDIPMYPTEPIAPNKFINKKTHQELIEDCDSSGTSINFSNVMKVRSNINVPDDSIFLVVNTTTDYDGDPQLDSIYFEWHDTIENPNYEKELETYKKKLAKYQADKEQYEIKQVQYKKDMRAYKKELKAYNLAQMKEQKERLEAQIAKAEKKK